MFWRCSRKTRTPHLGCGELDRLLLALSGARKYHKREERREERRERKEERREEGGREEEVRLEMPKKNKNPTLRMWGIIRLKNPT